MSEPPAIAVRGLSKKFSRSLKRAMWYGLVDIARAALLPHRFRSPNLAARVADASGPQPIPYQAAPLQVSGLRPPPSSDGLRPSEFWALQDVSFDLRRGECLGVVGHNGAGKSTLFSILSGIYGPTRGHVEIRGRLQALIALGAGFHPMLSGRENVYINGLILGLTEEEIARKFNAILEFAELGDFIDMPVKNYSSGMFVRLAFSVAAHLDPDILLVDEVLAVGDMAFQNKSFERMRSLLDQGVPMMFVSHSPQAVEMVATRVAWLDRGQVKETGDPREILRHYATFMEAHALPPGGGTPPPASTLQPMWITRVETLADDGGARTEYSWRESVRLRFHYENQQEGLPGYLNFILKKKGNFEVIFTSLCMLSDGLTVRVPKGTGSFDCLLRTPSLAAGTYEVWAGVRRAITSGVGQDMFQKIFHAGSFRIAATPEEMGRPGLPHAMSTHLPPLVMDHTWCDAQGNPLPAR
ncbi:MAG: ATP-binding cassette domain-containing protein [Kiritimatiellae bacterium]|nr:ATP-binding cassette domain-containing protein [Kiritimatiellia bacterium]